MYNQNRIEVMAIIPGRLAKSKGHHIVNPAGKEIQVPIDHISLSASETTINLSEMSRIIMKFGERFRTALEQAKEIHKDGDNDDAILQIHLRE